MIGNGYYCDLELQPIPDMACDTSFDGFVSLTMPLDGRTCSWIEEDGARAIWTIDESMFAWADDRLDIEFVGDVTYRSGAAVESGSARYRFIGDAR